MSAQGTLGVGMQPPGSLELSAPVWGVDPSTKRISVACVENGLEWVETLSLPQPPDRARLHRYALAVGELVPWLEQLATRDRPPNPPARVFVEEPFMPTDRRQKPTSYVLLGALWVALGQVLPQARFEEINAPAWKMRALGKGHGGAKPPEYFDWAREVAGYTGVIEDEAAAIGVATAGGVIVSSGADG